MKIGIMTFHRSYNYGSALQAYALNAFLRNMGYDAFTIDFWTERQRNLYSIYKPFKGLMSVAGNAQAMLYYRKLKKCKRRFETFLKEYLPMTEKTYTERDQLRRLESVYDAIICGSDQIWNPNCTDFDDAYLLSFVANKAKCMSYAPSIAVLSLPEDRARAYRNELNGYAAISCRERHGAEMLKQMTGRDIPVVLDPVFLLEKEKWDEIAQPVRKKPYILCYFLSDIDGMRAFARRLHRETNLPLVIVHKSLRDMLYLNHKEYSAGPREFLGLIRDAEYICTNSYHAVAFSLMCKKNFWAFVDTKSPTSSKSRIENIAELFHFQDRVFHSTAMDDMFDFSKKIDYHAIDPLIHADIERSKEYLIRSMEGIRNDTLPTK